MAELAENIAAKRARLLDALRTLDRIGITDPYRVEADGLRADIQRALFAAAGIQRSTPGSSGGLP